MSNEKKHNEEEVDLGTLFVIIGRGFSKLFVFIGCIFQGVFDFLIQILLFLKENYLKIGIAILIGIVYGGYLEFSSGVTYKSAMIVKPNFESSKQLYANIEYFNTLTKQKDKSALSSLFGLSKDEATSIKGFKIEPIKTENDIVKSYNKIVMSVDTLASKNYSYADFKKSFQDVDYYSHKIEVFSTKKDVFDIFNTTILKGVSDKKYFKNLQKHSLENINRSDVLFKKDLIQIDSLRSLYSKILLEESKRSNSETTINTGSNSKASVPKEIELFNTTKTINSDLRSVSYEKSERSEIINIISYFQAVGEKSGGVLGNNFIKFGLLGGLLMSVSLLLLKLNKFLENYKKDR